MYDIPDQLTLDYVFTFGKNKGKTLDDVAKIKDMSYILWCIENIDWFFNRIKENQVLKACLVERINEYNRREDERMQAMAWGNDVEDYPDDEYDDEYRDDTEVWGDDEF